MKSMPRALSILISCMFIMGCGGENTESNVEAPGDDKSAKSTVLGIGADVIQDKTPLNQVNVYLDGFHFYNGHIDGQMEAQLCNTNK